MSETTHEYVKRISRIEREFTKYVADALAQKHPPISFTVVGVTTRSRNKWRAVVNVSINGKSVDVKATDRRPSDAIAQAVGYAIEALMAQEAHRG